MSTRAQRAAEGLRETIERRLAARIAANDVDGVRAILDVAEYGIEIAAGSLDRMGQNVDSTSAVETGWSAPSAVQQQLVAERDAALRESKHAYQTGKNAGIVIGSEEAASKMQELIAERDTAIAKAKQERAAGYQDGKNSMHEDGRKIIAELEAERDAMLKNGERDRQTIIRYMDERDKLQAQLASLHFAHKHSQPAELGGVVKVHSGDDIPEPTPPPARSKPKKGTVATEDKWGKAQYTKQTDPGSGQKVYMGKGLAVHPSKKKQYKIQAENSPVEHWNGSRPASRAAVAKVKAKPVFPSVPEDIDRASQIITPQFNPDSVDTEDVPVFKTLYAHDGDEKAYDEYNAKRNRIMESNRQKRKAAQERFEAERVKRDKERSRKLSEGNLAAYKALVFWVHHRIKETRGLTASDRSLLEREHGEAVRQIASDVADEHGTTRDSLGIWIRENIDGQIGAIVDKPYWMTPAA